jgi:hypothetical protein
MDQDVTLEKNMTEMDKASATYRRLKGAISQKYPAGWYIGIADDQMVAAAADFHALESLLRSQGRDARQVLIVQAGAEYPDYFTIF